MIKQSIHLKKRENKKVQKLAMVENGILELEKILKN